jgi:hypothetical protein
VGVLCNVPSSPQSTRLKASTASKYGTLRSTQSLFRERPPESGEARNDKLARWGLFYVALGTATGAVAQSAEGAARGKSFEHDK